MRVSARSVVRLVHMYLMVRVLIEHLAHVPSHVSISRILHYACSQWPTQVAARPETPEPTTATFIVAVVTFANKLDGRKYIEDSSRR